MKTDLQTFSVNVGKKFNADGSARKFPGNTIISMIDHNAPVYNHLLAIKAMLESTPASQCFSWLPESSYHMTVIEGVCDQVRKDGYWTNKLALDAPLATVDDFFEQQFPSIPPLPETHMYWSHVAVNAGTSIQFKPCSESDTKTSCLTKMTGGISIRLKPCSEADAQNLAVYRENVSNCLGLRFPDHDSYEFHTSLAYNIIEPDEEKQSMILQFLADVQQYIESQKIEFTVTQPLLTFFDSMFAFEPKKFIRK